MIAIKKTARYVIQNSYPGSSIWHSYNSYAFEGPAYDAVRGHCHRNPGLHWRIFKEIIVMQNLQTFLSKSST